LRADMAATERLRRQMVAMSQGKGKAA